MKEQFECLAHRMAIEFIRIVTLDFHKHDVPMINRLLGVYNTYQNDERDGVDYIFDFQNKEDLVTCIQGGLTAEELAELVAIYNCGNGEDYTTTFLFGCNHETPHLLTYSALKNALLGNADEIVECMLKYPFCYDNIIYCRILTDVVESNCE
jgi:hypothetical protein